MPPFHSSAAECSLRSAGVDDRHWKTSICTVEPELSRFYASRYEPRGACLSLKLASELPGSIGGGGLVPSAAIRRRAQQEHVYCLIRIDSGENMPNDKSLATLRVKFSENTFPG